MAIDIKRLSFSQIDSKQLLADVIERLPGWATLALVVAIAWQLAQIIWALVPGSPLGDSIEAVGLPVATGSGGFAPSQTSQ